MRIVVDTNVLVSGTLNPHGNPGRVVDAILSERVTVLYDDRIVDEYRDVLRRPTFGFSRADVDTLVDFIEINGESIESPPLQVVLPDPDDLPFLEVAAAGSADGLVTGNVKHFKAQRGRHNVPIWTPADVFKHLT
jgi:uncharacterized protein